MHIEVLVEEFSAEVALQILIPRILGVDVSFAIHSFQGKPDLLRKLPNRLRGYRHWPDTLRIVVMTDTDGTDCIPQKNNLEQIARGAGFVTKTQQPHAFHLVNRLAIQELEAWFLGDMAAINAAYPRVPVKLAHNKQYRNPDTIRNTWEKLERILQDAGYFRGGLNKVEVARKITPYMDPEQNRSPSFQVFRQGLVALHS